MRVMSMKALRTFGPIILQRMTSYGMTTNIKKVDDRAAHFGQPLSFALCTILCFPYIIYILKVYKTCCYYKKVIFL